MSSSFKFVALFAVALFASPAQGDDDSLFSSIRAAKETYQRDSERLRDGVLKSLKKAADTARKTGNKSLVDTITEESDAFESKGTLPSVVSTREYQRQLRKSQERLEDIYLQTVKVLTKASMDDEAGTLGTELAEFQISAKIFHGKHYAVSKEGLSWHEAKVACERQKGHLAIVTNAAEARYLADMLKAEGVNIAYIGATDERKEGHWYWVDGKSVTYANWDRGRGQPNNNAGGGRVEHYAGIYGERDGMWWDFPERGEDSAFICQWD